MWVVWALRGDWGFGGFQGGFKEVPWLGIVEFEDALHDAVLKRIGSCAVEYDDEAALKFPISKCLSQKGLASDFPRV